MNIFFLNNFKKRDIEREIPRAMQLKINNIVKIEEGGSRVLIEYNFNSHYIKSNENGQKKTYMQIRVKFSNNITSCSLIQIPFRQW